jgi:hypothetical protein
MGIVFNNNSNMSLLTQASLILTPTAEKAGKLYSVVPSNGNGDMDVVRNTTATRVNSLGLIENAPVNEPRLNYEAGSPSILIEPQRTNLLVNSVLSGTGATPTSWITGIQTGTSTPVQSIKNLSINAYRFITSNTRQEFNQTFNLALNSISCFSVFVESVTTPIPVSQMIRVNPLAGGASTQVFLKNNIVITSSTNIEAGFTYTIQVTCTAPDSFQFRMGCGTMSNVTGNITLSMPQLETGVSPVNAYPTSYIPTFGSSQTRNSEIINKSAISTLIGQTEGTMFVNFKSNFIEITTGVIVRSILTLSDGTNNNRISLTIVKTTTRNYIDITVINLGVNLGGIQTDITTGTFKVAVKYKDRLKIFINGVSIPDIALLAIPSTNRVSVGSGSGEVLNGLMNNVQIYKTALTDTECINLTTL